MCVCVWRVWRVGRADGETGILGTSTQCVRYEAGRCYTTCVCVCNAKRLPHRLTFGTGGGFLRHALVVSWHACELSALLLSPLNSASDRSDRSTSSATWLQARATVMHSTSHLLGCWQGREGGWGGGSRVGWREGEEGSSRRRKRGCRVHTGHERRVGRRGCQHCTAAARMMAVLVVSGGCTLHECDVCSSGCSFNYHHQQLLLFGGVDPHHMLAAATEPGCAASATKQNRQLLVPCQCLPVSAGHPSRRCRSVIARRPQV